MHTNISIIIPCLNEEKYIQLCLNSILTSSIKNYEIILVDGGSSDSTIEVIKKNQQKYPFIKLLYNPNKFTPISMNIGIKNSKGDYIFIVSAHAKYQKDYFLDLVKYIKKLKANCVGGILSTQVKNSNLKSNSIKKVLTHKFGVGNADFRIGGDKIKEVDTIAFGCYTKNTFDKFGYYDERLIRNQDIELNKRIINGGGKIYLIPSIKAVYYARENLIDLAENNFANGKWNLLTAFYTKSINSLSFRHYIPLIFILSLLLPVIFSFINIKFLWISILSLMSYFVLVIIISLKINDKSSSFFYLIISFLVLHISYGLGSLIGLLSVIKKYLKKVKYE